MRRAEGAAASIIQSAMRGRITRQRLEEAQLEVAAQAEAATTLQRYVRQRCSTILEVSSELLQLYREDMRNDAF